MQILLRLPILLTIACSSELPPPGPRVTDLGGSKVRARLLTGAESFTAGGETLLAVQLTIAPGWHLYWRGANDTGLPLSLAWNLPEGVQVGPLSWPAPERHRSPGDLLDHVYYDELILLATVRVPEHTPAAALTVAVQLDWLVCEATCVPGEAVLELTLPVRQPGARGGWSHSQPPTPEAALIESALAALPGLAPAQLALSWSADRIRLTVPGARGLAFFPRDDCLPLADLLGTGESHGQTLELLRDRGFSGGERLIGILQVHGDGPGLVTHHLLDLADDWHDDHPR